MRPLSDFGVGKDLQWVVVDRILFGLEADFLEVKKTQNTTRCEEEAAPERWQCHF